MSYSGLVYSEMVPQASVMTSAEVNLKNMDDPLVCWRQPYENCTGFMMLLLPSASSLLHGRRIEKNSALVWYFSGPLTI